MKTIRRYLFAIIMLLVLFNLSTVYAASRTTSQGRQLIRVAVPVSNVDFDEQTDVGYVRYITEYLHEISQHTNWQTEIVTVPGAYGEGLQRAFQMLQDGTVDLVAPVRYTGEEGSEIYFSQHSFITATMVLQIPNSVYAGFHMGSEIHVAALQGNGLESIADEFFGKNHVSAQYLYFQSVEEQIKAVCSGQADVMLNSDLESISNMSVVAEFSPVQLYFAAADLDLLQELDQTLLYIQQANPSFSNELYEKYVASDSQKLTLEEESYIENAQPFVVAVLEGNEPYQYVDSRTREYCGIGVDLLQYISQEFGLNFEYVAVEDWDQLLQMIQENEIQIIAQIPYDYLFAAERDLTITSAYVSSPYMLAAQEGFQGPVSGQKLALTQVSTYTEGNYVGDVIRFENMGECIEAVYSCRADYTYVDLYTAQYYLGDPQYSRFSLIPQSYSPRSVCFGLTKPTDHELLSILNKAIRQISDAQLQNIITRNVNPTRDISLLSVVLAHPVQSLALIGAVSCLILGLLAVLLWRKSRVSIRLRQEAMKDGLTHLYHSSACRKLVALKLDQMGSGQLGAFLIMDLDDFKQINDQYGHQKGDWVLQRFAQLLSEISGKGSIISRIGGDEFVVYLDSVGGKEEMIAVCEKIRCAAHTIQVDQVPMTITVSIGATLATAGSNFDTLYRMADRALYKAKASQKDSFCVAQDKP